MEFRGNLRGIEGNKMQFTGNWRKLEAIYGELKEKLEAIYGELEEIRGNLRVIEGNWWKLEAIYGESEGN